MKTLIRSVLVTLSFVSVIVALKAQALSPPPDGGYPRGNTAEGQNALFSLTSGGYNTAVGFFSLRSNSAGNYNTAVGAGTLFANTAYSNTAMGAGALLSNTTGFDNTANGAFALLTNTIGADNTANGASALSNNTQGIENTANGSSALWSNTIGSCNTAVGYNALFLNSTGADNTAIGCEALLHNDTGFTNTATGSGALRWNTTGANNTAAGYGALGGNTEGSGNVALGFLAGGEVYTANHVICIGHPGDDVSNTTWIDNVYGVTTQSGTTAQVVVSDAGQLGTVASSERFKKDIVAMDRASEVVLSLRPVTFHYKGDTRGTPQFGLIAEEVAKVNPALVLPDKEGKPFTVRYDAVNAMLLNEFLKAHRKMEEQDAAIGRQQKQIEALTADLQKVSAQLEMSKAAEHMVSTKP